MGKQEDNKEPTTTSTASTVYSMYQPSSADADSVLLNAKDPISLKYKQDAVKFSTSTVSGKLRKFTTVQSIFQD